MRAATLLSLVLSAAVLCACGKDGEQSQTYAFVSKAHAAEGEAILIAFRPEPGDVYAMTLDMSGAMQLTGNDGTDHKVPMNMSMSMTYRCEQAQADGGRVMSMTMGEVGGALLDAAGAAGRLKDLLAVRTVMHMDRHGAVTKVEMEGGDPAARQAMEQMFDQPGSRPFLVYPPDGIRIGEAIDYAKLFESEQLRQILGAQGQGIETEVKGEAVAVRRLEIDGTDAVEFDLNLVMNFRGRMTQGGQSGEIDMGLRVTGTQFVAVASGMPVGHMRVGFEARGVIKHKDETMRMAWDMKIEGDTTRTVASDAPVAPAGPQEGR